MNDSNDLHLGAIQKITIRGFKSIRDSELELRNLNVIIGANGAGKSNFIQVFRMLTAMTIGKNLPGFVGTNGGANSFLHNGEITPEICLCFEFKSRQDGTNAYQATLRPTVDDKFLLSEFRKYGDFSWTSFGSPCEKSRLAFQKDEHLPLFDGPDRGCLVYDTISRWMVYHFHDTNTIPPFIAPMRQARMVEDYHDGLRLDASNIAPFLRMLREDSPTEYAAIVNAIRLVLPFFDDFRLDILGFRGEEQKVKLSWRQKGLDIPMQPYHLSDGSMRFICLATALLQPNPPSAIIIDEPELGLHPIAIAILAELIQAAAKRTQIIVATQSPALIDLFGIEDVIVAKREDGTSTFKRLNPEDFSVWLKDYSVGELWTKNVIEGGPTYE